MIMAMIMSMIVVMLMVRVVVGVMVMVRVVIVIVVVHRILLLGDRSGQASQRGFDHHLQPLLALEFVEVEPVGQPHSGR